MPHKVSVTRARQPVEMQIASLMVGVPGILTDPPEHRGEPIIGGHLIVILLNKRMFIEKSAGGYRYRPLEPGEKIIIEGVDHPYKGQEHV
jgi:hypothetical protein